MEVNIIKMTCCSCGVSYWLTTGHQESLVKTKESFYCPNGHSQSYTGDTDKQKYEKELKIQKESKENYRKWYEKEKQKAEERRKSIIGYKGMLGRYKKNLNKPLTKKPSSKSNKTKEVKE